MGQSYVLQIHTGSFLNAHTNFQSIKDKTKPIITRHEIKAVIVGWHLDQKLNQDILDYFHQFNITSSIQTFC